MQCPQTTECVTKRCTNCKETKPIEEFYKGSGKDGVRSTCKPCSQLLYGYTKDHLRRGIISFDKYKAHRKNSIKRLRRMQRFIAKYLSAHPCVDCGEDDIVVLDFDHVRGKKLFTMGGGISRSMANIKREIRKCEVRCRNCHRRETRRRSFLSVWFFSL